MPYCVIFAFTNLTYGEFESAKEKGSRKSGIWRKQTERILFGTLV